MIRSDMKAKSDRCFVNMRAKENSLYENDLTGQNRQTRDSHNRGASKLMRSQQRVAETKRPTCGISFYV